MRRSCASALCSVLAATACAFEDGLPWSEARVRLSVGLDVPEDRMLDGAVRTSRDYAVHLERLTVTLDAFRISLGNSGSSSTGAFDPADPPAGYSNCHNGHCHSDDGRLVDYAEIEAELLGGAATGPSADHPLELELDVPPGGDVEVPAVPLDLPMGGLVSFGLSVSGVRIVGRVDDLRLQSRLTEDTENFDLSLPVRAELIARLEGESSRDGPAEFDVRAHLALPLALLDQIDFAATRVEPETVSGVLSNALRVETQP